MPPRSRRPVSDSFKTRGACAGVLACALLLASAPSPAAAGHPGPGDWGDAPEGAEAYPSLGVPGLFPTCFAGPAGYIWHGNPGLAADIYWGFDVDDEIDGNAGFCPPPPYERDECWGPFDGDGGLATPDTYTINAGQVIPCGQTPPQALGSVCQVLNLTVGGPFEANLVNNTGLPGFVNVLFDWNQDGRWGGASQCGGLTFEHAIQNLPVPVGYVGPLTGLNPGPIQIGPNPGFVWIRMTLSNMPVPLDWDGSDLFDLGETEDYLIRIDDVGAAGDFGDAPEGAMAYPGVIGEFPTCITLGPAGYVYHAAVDDLFFGPLVDWETEGNANTCPPPAYDADECNGGGGDGGILMPMPITLAAGASPTTCPNGAVGPSLVGCLTARWGVEIDIQVTNNSAADRYFHLLADWDGDGKWTPAVQTCPNGINVYEHVIGNFPIPSGHSGPLSSLSPPDFTVGFPADGMSWFRFTLSDAPVPPDWDGTGNFGEGETEDYLFRISQPPVDAPELREGTAGPAGLRLDSVRPNPMTVAATVTLTTARPGRVRVEVYDAAGREVTWLHDGAREAGTHAFSWDGRDVAGRPVTPGVYFVRATQDGDAATAKVVVVR